MPHSTDELWPELEKDGVETVRKKLADKAYGTDKAPEVEEWLRHKREQKEERARGNTTAGPSKGEVQRLRELRRGLLSYSDLLAISPNPVDL